MNSASQSFVNEENFFIQLARCEDYLADNSPTELKALLSHDGGMDLKTFLKLTSTTVNVLCFGAEKLDSDYSDICSNYEKTKLEAEADFEVVCALGLRLLDLASGVIEAVFSPAVMKNIFPPAAVISKIASVTAHNLCVLSYRRRLESLITLRENMQRKIRERVMFISLLAHRYCDRADVISYLKSTAEDVRGRSDFLSPAAADLRLFAYYITLGKSKLEGYLESIRGKESRHWYNAYRILSEQEDNEDFRRQAELVGEFLCKCFASVAVKRIIYHSIFYECIALEYAYRTGQTSLAREILMSGYDFYLELDSLRILYEYDKDTFEEQIAMLKRICLTRKIAMLTSRSTHNCDFFINTYGKDFSDELVKLASEALATIDESDPTDPRNRDTRATPPWAE